MDNHLGAMAQRGAARGRRYREFVGIDIIRDMPLFDNSPQYKAGVVEETDEFVTVKTDWGVKKRTFRNAVTTPEFLDFVITDPSKWAEAKKRMTPSRDRIPWDYLKENYPKWRREGEWIRALLWFGYDVMSTQVVGTERTLIAMADDPEWCIDFFHHGLDVGLALLDMVWDAGYTFDAIKWWDDMGYTHKQFFSLRTYRELLKPAHKKAIEWAHKKGVKVNLHSCGDINPFVPELVEIGLDALNPLQVNAGMNPVELKKTYGKILTLQGGINAVLWPDIDAIEEEIKRVLPIMKESGGYIFSSDHSVPPLVSFENYQHIVRLAKEQGSFS